MRLLPLSDGLDIVNCMSQCRLCSPLLTANIQSPTTIKMLRPAIDVEALMEQLTLEEKVQLSAGKWHPKVPLPPDHHP